MMKPKGHRYLFQSLFAPILFELCGIIPLVLVALGIVNISTGIALRNVLVYQYTWVFFSISAAFFSFSVYLFLKQRNSCNLKGLIAHRRLILAALFGVSVIELLTLFIIKNGENIIYHKTVTYFFDFVSIGLALTVIILLFLIVVTFIGSKGEERSLWKN